MSERTYLGIDHIVIRTAVAEPLIDLLSGPLGLPVTWPLERASFANFGWTGAGNTNIEIWAAADNSDLPVGCPFPLIQQIALAPVELQSGLKRLEAIGLKCKEPRAYQSRDELGALQTNFTNSVLLDLSHDSCCVFFCEWGSHAPITPWRNGLSTLERRQLHKEAMVACGGGPLGMVGLQKIAISTRNLEGSAAAWSRLTHSSKAELRLIDDIELQLSVGSQDLIQSLTFAVQDLAAARSFLDQRGLLDDQHPDEVALAAAATGGIRLLLAQGV